VSTIGKKLVKQQYLPTYSRNMANVGPLTAEISLPVWGTPANFNRFRVLAVLLHGTLHCFPKYAQGLTSCNLAKI